MNISFKQLLLGFCLIFGLAMLSSCSKKSGCPAETASNNVDKHGQLKTKPGKSNLFPKDTRKKMKRN